MSIDTIVLFIDQAFFFFVVINSMFYIEYTKCCVVIESIDDPVSAVVKSNKIILQSAGIGFQ